MKKMQYKIIILLLIFIYIYSGSLKEYMYASEDLYVNEIQKEFIVNKKDIDVFKKKKLDDINVVESRIKIWNIIIAYNENNYDNVKKKLLNSGYQTKDNKTAEVFKSAQSTVDIMASKGVIHKNKAARIKSRLNKQVKSA